MPINTTSGINGYKVLDWTKFWNVIDGRLESTKETCGSINPATGKPWANVPLSTQDDVETALKAAKTAFKSWSTTTWESRAELIRQYADAIEAEKANFAELLVNEQGKPLQFATSEVDGAVHFIRTFADLKLREEITEESDKVTVVRYNPLGVVVCIVPWNFPILIAVGKIASAILTGNTVLVKPSPFTPASGLKLAELAQQFFPPGVVQGLSGDDNLGPWLTSHPIPAKVSFTGSTATGKKVMEACSKTLKRVTLELGGKDPAIVCEDVDIDEVAAEVANRAFLNSGQICTAVKRVFVHEKIYDQFRDAMVKHTQLLKVGEGHQDGVFMGPINNGMQYDRVKGFLDDIEKEKLNVACGGENPGDGSKGYFINPTIIDQPSINARISTEEPFGQYQIEATNNSPKLIVSGPILPLFKYNSYGEAVELANDTGYGLGASVWSKDIKRANAIARQIESGTVWINTHFEVDPRFPFGGHKQSGIGAEWGVEGLKIYCNTQTLYLKKE